MFVQSRQLELRVKKGLRNFPSGRTLNSVLFTYQHVQAYHGHDEPHVGGTPWCKAEKEGCEVGYS